MAKCDLCKVDLKVAGVSYLIELKQNEFVEICDACMEYLVYKLMKKVGVEEFKRVLKEIKLECELQRVRLNLR